MLPTSCSPQASRRSPRRRRLLIVDDNDFIRSSLAALLDHEPDLLVCGTAASGSALDQSIADCHPDLLVIDLLLGAENGLDLARSLRQRGIDTPFCFTSSLSTPAAGVLHQIGRCSFWRKGGHYDVLLNRIREMLTRYSPGARRAPRQHAS